MRVRLGMDRPSLHLGMSIRDFLVGIQHVVKCVGYQMYSMVQQRNILEYLVGVGRRRMRRVIHSKWVSVVKVDDAATLSFRVD